MKKPSFQLIFITALMLTVGSGGAALHLASQPRSTEVQGRILDGAMDTWKMGILTLIGLLSVGVANRNDDDDDDAAAV